METGGKGDEEEPNETAARKPGPLLIIHYFLLQSIKLQAIIRLRPLSQAWLPKWFCLNEKTNGMHSEMVS